MDLRNLWMPPGPREVGDFRMFMKILGWRKLVPLLPTPPSSWSGGAPVKSKSKQHLKEIIKAKMKNKT